MHALYLCVAALAVVIVVGKLAFWTAPGARIVPGRRWAWLSYASLFSGVCVLGMVLYTLRAIYPILSTKPEVHPSVFCMMCVVPTAVLCAVLYMAVLAHGMSRSVLFYHVRRDELGPLVARVLKQMQVPFKHRLHTFKDEFVLADGRIYVHGGSHASRLELPGRNPDADAALTDAIVREVTAHRPDLACMTQL